MLLLKKELCWDLNRNSNNVRIVRIKFDYCITYTHLRNLMQVNFFLVVTDSIVLILQRWWGNGREKHKK